ncbi:MAG: response regulator [Leptospiraceae bacterium]|nr:response regulator [Leptospiraceae bacterium]MDW7975219.1 response regulator [Leptospiraceae bacterium]
MKHILLADDSEIILDIVKKTLTMYFKDYSILEAKDGKDALEKAKTYKDDIRLYVLDVNMPHIDGISLIKHIRSFDKETPILMLTTEVEKAKIEKAKEYGATGWIVKPFEGEKFIQIVKMLLE